MVTVAYEEPGLPALEGRSSLPRSGTRTEEHRLNPSTGPAEGKEVRPRAAGEAARAGQAPSSESLSRALLAAVLDPTIAIDSFGTIVVASNSVETVFGWSPTDLVGQNIKVLLPEPHRSLHDEYLSNYRRTGATNILGRTRQFDVVHKEGRLLQCELSVARAEMPGGSAPLFIGSFRDVTDRLRVERALELSERRARAIFNRSYEYIGLLHTDGTVLEVNQAALDAIGAPREAILGQKFWDTPWWSVTPESRERVKQAIAEAALGKFVRFEAMQRGRGEEVLAVDFSINPVRDASGAVTYLVPEGRDITDIKRAQRAETSMLRALAAIGESAAMLAHEIKNPITAVNTALRAVAEQLGEDHRVVLDDLVSRMQRLERMMRRTLAFTRPLELRLSDLEAATLLEQSAGALRLEISQRGAK